MLNRLAASRRFQSWAARFPLTRGIARREGEELFDLVAGFVHSQALMALVVLRILHMLMEAPARPAALAGRVNVAPERLEVLLQAGAALGLLKKKRDGRFALARKGAAMLGVPGLEAMIRHHDVLYRDLADPVAFLRGETDPELARFWPYVFGAAAAEAPEIAERYSDLMAESQGLVAEDTLATVRFDGIGQLMDVGGGTGAFLTAVGQAVPGPRLTLFDLPAVVPGAEARFAAAGLTDRVRIVSGSFRDDPLPEGADAISLVRVLYDHADETVRDLLQKTHAALPPGGRLIVSEPMGGGDRPDRAGDVYFALYCMAMRTGKARSQADIAALLKEAGFERIETPRPRRAFVTSVVTAVRCA
jgi:demethylspheroidene O-methyltransferase